MTSDCFIQRFDKKLTNRDLVEYFVDHAVGEDDAFYIVDVSEVQKAYDMWHRLLPNVHPYYAVKCNPSKAIIKILSDLGVGFDCASCDEMNRVLEITHDPSRIIFANPCKMVSHMWYANVNNVDMMTFDCKDELHKIRAHYPHARLLLRLAVDDSHSVCQFNSKFGCHLDNVDALLQEAKSMSLNVVGFSFHVGSGCMKPQVFYDALRLCRDAVDAATKYGFTCNLIDIGGGFPGNDETKFHDIATKITQGIHDFFPDNTTRFISEPGRFFVQRSHTLVMNVVGKKVVQRDGGHKTFVYYVNDGVYGGFNCIHYDHYNPVIKPIKHHDQLYKSTVFGPTCDSMDVIYKDVELPELETGDWVYVENFGAYTAAAASRFNGFRTASCKYVTRN